MYKKTTEKKMLKIQFSDNYNHSSIVFQIVECFIFGEGVFIALKVQYCRAVHVRGGRDVMGLSSLPPIVVT